MGVGNLLIGENQGAAQLFGHNPAIQQFGEMLAQRKAKQEQDNKVLNDYLSTSYDPGSLRNEADKTVYLKKYQDIKQQAIDAENERDETKKALKISEIRQQIGNLSAYAEGSKKQGLFERGSAAVELGKNPDHYEDESVKRFNDGLEKNWDDPTIIKNFSDIERRVDPNKLQEEYKKLKQEQIEPTQWGNPVKTSTLTFDGKKKAIFQQNRGVPIDGDNGAYETFLHKVTADPNWKKGLRDMYPDVNTGNPQADLALRARKYMHDQGDTQGWFDKPKETQMEGETPDRFYDHYDYREKHPLSDTQNPPAEIKPVENLAYKGGQANLNAKNWVGVSIANKNFGGAPAIDMKTGQAIKALDPSGEYSIVGAGDFPVVKAGMYAEYKDPKTGKKVKMGQNTPVEPEFEAKNPNAVDHKRMVLVQRKDDEQGLHSYLVKYDDLPSNVKNQKDVRTTFKRFDQTPVYGKDKEPKQVTSQEDYDSLPVGAQYMYNGQIRVKK